MIGWLGMQEGRRQELIDDLRAQIRAQELGVRPFGTLPTLPFGIPEIDSALPTGGLALGAVHEVIGGGPDAGFGATATMFIGGILARTNGPIIWAISRRDLFAPALANVGVHPDRVIYVEAGDSKAVLLIVEEALRHVGLAAVVGEIEGAVGLTASRRLQLAAETSGGLGLLLRRPRRLAQDHATEPTAARTRWRVTPVPSGPALAWSPSTSGLARALWRLELLRCRGGEPRTFEVEACDETGRLGVPAHVADRSAASDATPLRAANG
ncbi:MAG TPA: damage-inducible protein [Aliidongia sp.]|nr:damage-inducible protein [Aliidongia sp.]